MAMKYVTQLNPTIPFETPKGRAEAIALIDYGPEHHLAWVVFLDKGGQCWTFQNPDIRGCANPTMGRTDSRLKQEDLLPKDNCMCEGCVDLRTRRFQAMETLES